MDTAIGVTGCFGWGPLLEILKKLLGLKGKKNG